MLQALYTLSPATKTSYAWFMNLLDSDVMSSLIVDHRVYISVQPANRLPHRPSTLSILSLPALESDEAVPLLATFLTRTGGAFRLSPWWW